jgi:hypothetical protein
MLFRAIGKEPKYSMLLWIFDTSIDLLQWLADIFQNEQLENAVEVGLGRHGRNRFDKLIAATYGRS